MSITNRYFTSLQHPLVGLVDLLHGDHLDVAHDLVLRAEIEHLLRRRATPSDRERGRREARPSRFRAKRRSDRNDFRCPPARWTPAPPNPGWPPRLRSSR